MLGPIGASLHFELIKSRAQFVHTQHVLQFEFVVLYPSNQPVDLLVTPWIAVNHSLSRNGPLTLLLRRDPVVGFIAPDFRLQKHRQSARLLRRRRGCLLSRGTRCVRTGFRFGRRDYFLFLYLLLIWQTQSAALQERFAK